MRFPFHVVSVLVGVVVVAGQAVGEFENLDVERRQLDVGGLLPSLSLPSLSLPSLSLPSISFPSIPNPLATTTSTSTTSTSTTTSSSLSSSSTSSSSSTMTMPPIATMWTTHKVDKGSTLTSTVTEYDCECTTTYLTTVTKGKPCTSTIVVHTKKSSTMMAYTDEKDGWTKSSSYYKEHPTPGYTYTPPTTTSCVPSTSTVYNTVTMTVQMMCTPSTIYQTSTASTCYASSVSPMSSYSYSAYSAPSSSDSWGQAAHPSYTTSYPGMQYSPRNNDGKDCHSCVLTTVTVEDTPASVAPPPTTSSSVYTPPQMTYCPPTTYTSTTMACSTTTMSSMTTSTQKAAFAAEGAAAPSHSPHTHTLILVLSSLFCVFVLPPLVMRI